MKEIKKAEKAVDLIKKTPKFTLATKTPQNVSYLL